MTPTNLKNITAPIVLFVYNRPWHTSQTIKALKENEFAECSNLFIYSDGPKNRKDANKVHTLREYLRSVRGFKNVRISEREKNWGLAKNIVNGVNEVINEYGRAIILEDDLVTSPYFLRFMNEALEIYKNEKKIWHISGWNYPIDTEGLTDTFLWRVMNCWGWATWADRWKNYKRNPMGLLEEFSKEDIEKFNLDGAHNFWSQIEANVNGRLTTWAIFWYAHIFRNSGLCLNPSKTLVKNIGHDGSGIHCGRQSGYDDVLSLNKIPINYQEIRENEIAVYKIRSFYKSTKQSLLRRAISKLKHIMI